jgi:hypothetical protein
MIQKTLREIFIYDVIILISSHGIFDDCFEYDRRNVVSMKRVLDQVFFV